jgi:putative selenate reductase
MARLRPYPFAALVRRMFRELDQRGSIFDLPRRLFFCGAPGKDLSVRVHGHTASTPFGPAAGPHTQLAQNIVLSWLAGGRIIELKTVQINDALTIPRPCMDMRTVGFNVEWSQELRLEESLEEYVKASMLIAMLAASGRLAGCAAAGTVFDMSVGYDLAGITSDRVVTFMRGMLDASEMIERLRSQIPSEYRQYRNLDFQPRVSDTLTLSTFHGCPPGEIEQTVEFLQRSLGLHVTVKLNPTLLGKDDTLAILHDVLRYRDIAVPGTAFDRDLQWDAALEMVERLGTNAARRGLGFGVKLTNTLVVENRGDFLPADQPEMYLSGPPLHVLAMTLVARFRRAFGDRYPISFSGGIDRVNFPDAVALGLAPVTVCTDLLKPGGYGRARAYMQNLVEAMDASGATSIDDFVLSAFATDSPSVSAAKLRNTELYLDHVMTDRRYTHAENSRAPKGVRGSLVLFDCIACDKCVPVCPNDANFTFVLPNRQIPMVRAQLERAKWRWSYEGVIRLDARHQIGNFADFCNDCGNCDVFCPEDGDPHLLKPRVFGSVEAWAESATDGFVFTPGAHGERVLARFSGNEYRLEPMGRTVHYSGPGFGITFDPADPEGTIDGHATAVIDFMPFQVMNALGKALLASPAVNYINALRS